MASTYTQNNKLEKPGVGEQAGGTWGSTSNTNFDLIDSSVDGFVAVALTGTTHTLNIPDAAAADGRNKVISFTGTLAAANTVTVTPNTVEKLYFLQNNTTGGQNVIIAQGSGSTVTIKPGYSSIVYLDGAGAGAGAKEVLTSLKLTNLLEATGVVFVGSSSGNTTLQANATASGTLTLPAATDTLVGKATTDTFTNKTLDTAGAGNVLRINGTQVSAVTGTGSVVLATSPTLVTPLLGTPTSGTLTNCTGLPISSGVSGLGTNVATFLATPSSANLASAVTDETGSGALVFGTSPTIATPTITTSATVPLVIGGTGTTSTLTLRSTSGVGTTGADIVFQTGNNGATEVMRLKNDGNVGIGTTIPAYQAQVNGLGQTTAALTDAGNKGGSILIADIGAAAGNGGALLFAASVINGLIPGCAIKSLLANGTANGQSDLAFSTRNATSDTSLTERMRILSTGEVGIGTASPAYQLQLSTDSAAKPSTNTWTIASDERLKTVLGDYEKGLDEICALRPVRYEYNGLGGMQADGKEHISIVAQEAQEVFPECIGTFSGKLHEDDEEETELLNYNGHAVTFALINAVRELKTRVEALELQVGQ